MTPDELATHIERLVGKTLATCEREAAGEHGRIARSVVLRLRTSDFRILTRTLAPPERPSCARELAEIA